VIRRVGIRRVGVVIPAYDEAATVGACVRSVAAAAARCPVEVRIVVVADSCSDDTAAVARSAGASVVEVRERNVGRVRAAGCQSVIADGATGLWLAHTDADSTVPPDWLATQLRYAADGADVVAGPVEVDGWDDWPSELRERYDAYYTATLAGGGQHIHGCNLGLSASAYQLAGGYPPLGVGEDRALLAAAAVAGLTIVHPADLVVRTSGRRHARVVGGGFHRFLALLAAT
jgi:glycosyltransferase involved in cell wall biosynthesis